MALTPHYGPRRRPEPTRSTCGEAAHLHSKGPEVRAHVHPPRKLSAGCRSRCRALSARSPLHSPASLRLATLWQVCAHITLDLIVLTGSTHARSAPARSPAPHPSAPPSTAPSSTAPPPASASRPSSPPPSAPSVNTIPGSVPTGSRLHARQARMRLSHRTHPMQCAALRCLSVDFVYHFVL